MGQKQTLNSNLPVIRQLAGELGLAQGVEPHTKIYRMGPCKIMVSPPYQDQGWHMSISRRDRYPSWDEIAKAWYELVPGANGITGAMILPPKEQYVNIHNWCLHIHQIPNEDIPR